MPVLLAFIPYAIASIVHVLVLGLGEADLVLLTKPFLMPALALGVVVALAGRGRRLLPWALAGIGLSWLGDIALQLGQGIWFLLGLGFFLLAHLAYLRLFAREGSRPLPAWTAVYLLWFGALVWLLAPHLGELLVPVIVYGAVLGAMATASTRLGWLGALGGAFFVVSDSLLAIRLFHPTIQLPWEDVSVMVTYLLAQLLIALAAVSAGRRIVT